MRLEAREVTVRYPGAPDPALDRVSVQVAEGALCAVLGPNGSGKSTLTRALLGAVPLAGGEALLDGRPVAEWSRRALARAVGVVPQSEPLPFPLSVRELVSMGRYAHLGPLARERARDREAVEAALSRCDVAHLAERTVQTLSGGELQRVRIARALAQEPRALILDEPTAALDIRHEMAILELLAGSAQCGITILLVTHHLDLAARYAHRLLLLDRGRLAATGTPAEVLTPETVTAVYRWPVAVRTDELTGSPRVVPLPGPHPS
ncbi:MAG: ABC transporter ATP-binding protein [Longimicrobiales bacterium]|nr:ABC transporter ATP-binding protein [Longimicrobiales bacterium]